MKEVLLRNGRIVRTPWLKPEEAAAYCGVSRTFFDYHGRNLPHGGNARTRLYHTNILDAWINNELDVPFTRKKTLHKRIKPRRTTNVSDEEMCI